MSGSSFRKVRIFFTKEGDSRFLSHLDLMRTMERAIRRSALPIRFTEGMNPKVKMSFPTALPLGMESRCEVMEIQVEPQVTLRQVCERLAAELPATIHPFDGDALFPGEKWRLTSIQYEIRAGEDGLPPAAELEALLARERIPVERRGKEIDLARFVERLARDEDRVRLSIGWSDTGTARPEDVLRALGRDPDRHEVRKLGLTFLSSLGETIRKSNDPEDPDQRP